MSDNKSAFEFFPKEKIIRLPDAFIYLLLFGTFGAHQFYLGNKKRAYYLLVTCGISHILVLFSSQIYPFLYLHLGVKLALATIFVGYALGAPVLIWDFITLSGQVRNKKGQADLL
jgi:TM2 domain-containing membrane protein YozV